MRDQLKPQPCLISSNPSVAAEISASFTPSDISPGRCCCFGPDSLSLFGHMSCFSLHHRAIPCAVVCSHGRRGDWWMSGLNAGRLEVNSRTEWACRNNYICSSNAKLPFCFFAHTQIPSLLLWKYYLISSLKPHSSFGQTETNIANNFCNVYVFILSIHDEYLVAKTSHNLPLMT